MKKYLFVILGLVMAFGAQYAHADTIDASSGSDVFYTRTGATTGYFTVWNVDTGTHYNGLRAYDAGQNVATQLIWGASLPTGHYQLVVKYGSYPTYTGTLSDAIASSNYVADFWETATNVYTTTDPNAPVVTAGMFDSVDIAEPTTLLTAFGDFFTSFKNTIQPIVLWGIGLGILLSLVGIVYAFVRKGRRAAR